MNVTPSSQSASRLGPLWDRLEKLSSPHTEKTGGKRTETTDTEMEDVEVKETTKKEFEGAGGTKKSPTKGASREKSTSFAANNTGDDLSMDLEDYDILEDEQKETENLCEGESGPPKSVSIHDSVSQSGPI